MTDSFSEKVRARVTELTGIDPGKFTVGGISPGPRWHTLTEAEQVDVLAQSIARRDEWTHGPPESGQPKVNVRDFVSNLNK